MNRAALLSVLLAAICSAPVNAQAPPPPPGSDPAALALYAQNQITIAVNVRDMAWAGKLVATTAHTVCVAKTNNALALSAAVVSWCQLHSHAGPPLNVSGTFNNLYSSAVLGLIGGSQERDAGIAQSNAGDSYLAAAMAAYQQPGQMANAAAAAFQAAACYNASVNHSQTAFTLLTNGANAAQGARDVLAPWYFQVSGIQWP